MNSKDRDLAFSTIGNGYPVIFVHGFLESKEIWYDLVNELPFQSICIDLPGHGESGDVPFNSIAGVVPLIQKILKKLEINAFHIVGHSLGGYAALEVKDKLPGCGKVVLLNSNFWSDSDHKKKERERVAGIVRTNKSHFIHEVIPNLFADPELYAEIIVGLVSKAMEMSSESIAETSIAMKNRVDHFKLILAQPNDFCVIQGKNDTVMPIDTMNRKLADTGVDYFIVESGHMALIESQQEVREILRKEL